MKGKLLILLLFLLNGCIVPYDAIIDEDYELVSIEGSLIKGESEQKLIISRTASLDYPEFNPISGCEVSVIDDQNNQYFYMENLRGNYSLFIPDDQLVFNRKYKLQILTPEGQKYESAFETLVSGAEVDTVYYEMEEKYDKITDEDLYGVQFYIDLKAADTISRYYRWNLEETYEIVSVAPISFYYVAEGEIEYPEDDMEFFHCWKTEAIRSLFLSNTANLVVNEKKKIPLNYVDTDSDRLKIKYSLFVRQYTMSEGAYNYWQKAKNETQDAGGLYSQQPGRSLSNLHNVNDTSELVLGYFWLSHSTEQRIFVPGISSIDIIGNNCELIEYQSLLHDKGPFPRYVYDNQIRDLIMTTTQECFNCTYRGGSLTKPDYWE